jgi:hypothetical protein
MTAALDAITRLDFGQALPGDAVIAAIFEAHCQWEQARRVHAQDTADLADWLSQQCGGCHDGGTGEPCDEHDGEVQQ